MAYRTFHCSRIGASHIKLGLPCQDSTASETYKDTVIAVVADGHGSRRHFRSDRGSKIACEAAIESIRTYVDETAHSTLPLEERLTVLKKNILTVWRKRVLEDLESSPLTEAELNEVRGQLRDDQFERLIDGTDSLIPYGSTLCAVWKNERQWTALQLGDGDFVCISREGLYTWPMPKSEINQGNKTASLCMADPMLDFRHCTGNGHPAGLLIYSDGIEKVFPPQGKELVSFLYWVWKNEWLQPANFEDNLKKTLDGITNQSRIGDDISIAGIIDPDASDSKPQTTLLQRQSEIVRINARIDELKSTIEHNKKQLAHIWDEETDSVSADKLIRINIQKGEELRELQKLVEKLKNDLIAGIPDAAELKQTPANQAAAGEMKKSKTNERDKTFIEIGQEIMNLGKRIINTVITENDKRQDGKTK